ncbi:helix-turn-helix transcriptional regulator [Falcatimonas sp. MSJ-15]|uniref:helix-turn-helix domain-containing protein n=1 Tax=Falcatimonas sp. MSJ-15 TaxID=2841515 RepID=UPI001C0F66E1|nr:helix-turn-helix transcriptional regulator [Falcatimonas sp. MSJ-15]MBU5471726.1 helix-turn-helix transcriptional regulator [Falcatimonas sp. MSJ-15]
MKVDYSKFFAKLKSENIKQKDFRDKAKISGVTMQKMLHNESVTIDSICKVCDYFRCMPDEIMEFIPEENYPEDIKAKQQAKANIEQQISELEAKLKKLK